MADKNEAVGDTSPLSELQKLYNEAPPSVLGDADSKMRDRALAYFSEPIPEKRVPNQTLRMIDDVLGAYFETKQKGIDQWITEASFQQQNIDQSLTESEKKLVTMADRLQRFQDNIGDPQKALEAFKASIREELQLQDARKLWTGSADKAQNAYAISWIILIALLLGVPAYAISQYQAIIDFFHQVNIGIFKDIPPGSSDTVALISAISRLFLITVPVAMYLWLIRIVVRFNTRSLLLMDDARQRNTMLETYLHLVERDKEAKGERPLILEALFRRTPGHGGDTIDPPSLPDVLRITNPR
ncbi:DUF6161 domain-containing protein [Mesorhizobium sp.]|uniref:DUF6161 domain-containing protein n=1 Tax=Mesorhizobium sp. TaxID=1871066 RepID=UPI000FE4B34D|nr:DUF6161 domain-containing protein [Mesorhizobium sp.]RWN11775.1 MAG: hypothetical protein EOR87_14750 [Mesorhizobium sp.]RWN19438.1 MAG: hypothetical protein EOR88_09815 [Mesorhizobium sp.]